MTRHHQRPLTWLALVAVLAMALLPTLSHALAFVRGDAGRWAEVCTPQGMRLVAVDDAAGAADATLPTANSHLEHCPLCALGAGAMAPPPAPLWCCSCRWCVRSRRRLSCMRAHRVCLAQRAAARAAFPLLTCPHPPATACSALQAARAPRFMAARAVAGDQEFFRAPFHHVPAPQGTARMGGCHRIGHSCRCRPDPAAHGNRRGRAGPGQPGRHRRHHRGRVSSLPTQIPTTIEGITGAEIEAKINATDSEDALRYFPSLLVRKRYIGDYNHAVLSSRASGTGNSARSMVYADGILLSNYLGMARPSRRAGGW